MAGRAQVIHELGKLRRAAFDGTMYFFANECNHSVGVFCVGKSGEAFSDAGIRFATPSCDVGDTVDWQDVATHFLEQGLPKIRRIWRWYYIGITEAPLKRFAQHKEAKQSNRFYIIFVGETSGFQFSFTYHVQ